MGPRVIEADRVMDGSSAEAKRDRQRAIDGFQLARRENAHEVGQAHLGDTNQFVAVITSRPDSRGCRGRRFPLPLRLRLSSFLVLVFLGLLLVLSLSLFRSASSFLGTKKKTQRD